MLEKESGFKWKQNFFVGYSPERVKSGRAGSIPSKEL
jgi:UDP-N-acetyl-D-mannosaminuronate dehydrogenase